MREYKDMFIWAVTSLVICVITVNIVSCARLEVSSRVELRKYTTDLQKYCIDKAGIWIDSNNQCILK